MTTPTVVAMSGGVDSSVAALLLHQDQQAIIGVSMQVWDYRKNGGSASRATCCSPSDFGDARKVAGKLGIPYYVFDFEAGFHDAVIKKFVNSYANGLTPNPCVECNNKIKFKELRNRSFSIGCSKVATGHYAQIKNDESGYHLLRSVDKAKDQSYFLYGLTQAELSETVFPIGAMTKPEVRALAREFGLVTADKAESQDICFVSGEIGDFLVQLGVHKKRGDIVNKSGQKVGEHDGVQQFTIGQRKGLSLGGNDIPLYITQIEPEANRVVVGPRAELEKEAFKVEGISWCVDSPFDKSQSIRCLAQLRHRQIPVEVELTLEDSVLAAKFKKEWALAVPGQAAVFYTLDNCEVLGGGTISRE